MPYPEHEKMKAVEPAMTAVRQFIDWLACEKEFEIAEWAGDNLSVIHTSSPALLAEYFEIDETKLEAERRKMLFKCRKANDRAEDSSALEDSES
jgi:hypothetical protein